MRERGHFIRESVICCILKRVIRVSGVRSADLYKAITYLYRHCHPLWRAIFMCRTFIALNPGQYSPNDNPSIKN